MEAALRIRIKYIDQMTRPAQAVFRKLEAEARKAARGVEAASRGVRKAHLAERVALETLKAAKLADSKLSGSVAKLKDQSAAASHSLDAAIKGETLAEAKLNKLRRSSKATASQVMKAEQMLESARARTIRAGIAKTTTEESLGRQDAELAASTGRVTVAELRHKNAQIDVIAATHKHNAALAKANDIERQLAATTLTTGQRLRALAGSMAMAVGSRIGSAFSGIGRGLQNISARFIRQGSTAQMIGMRLMTGLTVPIVSLGVLSTKTFLDIEKSWVRLRKVLPGNSAGDVEKLLNSLRRVALSLSNEFGLAQETVVDAFAEFSKAGITSRKDLIALSRIAAETAIEFDTDLPTATGVVTKTMLSFGLTVGQTRQALAVLDKIADETTASEKGLGQAISIVGGLAKVALIDIRHLGAMIAALEGRGIAAAEGANMLKYAIQRLTDPTDKAAESMMAYAVSMDEVSWRGLTGSQKLETLAHKYLDVRSAAEQSGINIREWIKRMDQSGDVINTGNMKLNDFAAALGKLVGKRQASKLISLLDDMANGFDKDGKSVSQYQKALKATEKPTKTLSLWFRKVGGFLKSQPITWERMKQALRNTAFVIGRELLPYAMSLLTTLVSLMDRFNKLSRAQKALLIVTALLLAAIGPVVKVFGALMTIAGALLSPIGFLAGGLQAILTIILLLGAAWGIIKNWKAIKGAASDLFDSLGPLWDKLRAVYELWTAKEWDKKLQLKVEALVGKDEAERIRELFGDDFAKKPLRVKAQIAGEYLLDSVKKWWEGPKLPKLEMGTNEFGLGPINPKSKQIRDILANPPPLSGKYVFKQLGLAIGAAIVEGMGEAIKASFRVSEKAFGVNWKALGTSVALAFIAGVVIVVASPVEIGAALLSGIMGAIGVVIYAGIRFGEELTGSLTGALLLGLTGVPGLIYVSLLKALPYIEQAGEWFLDTISPYADKIGNAFMSVAGWVNNAIISMTNNVIDMINVLIRTINLLPGVQIGLIKRIEAPSSAKKKIQGVDAIPTGPAAASGGWRSYGMHLLGEQGPELVLPSAVSRFFAQNGVPVNLAGGGQTIEGRGSGSVALRNVKLSGKLKVDASGIAELVDATLDADLVYAENASRWNV